MSVLKRPTGLRFKKVLGLRHDWREAVFVQQEPNHSVIAPRFGSCWTKYSGQILHSSIAPIGDPGGRAGIHVLKCSADKSRLRGGAGAAP